MDNVFTLEQIFSGKVLRIPDYQRGYAWEERQWNEFLDDLEYLGEGKDHYTGTLILQQQNGVIRDEEGKSHEVFHVVDGQQRLTTIVLLLDCIRSAFQQKNPTLADGIRKSYIQFKDLNRQVAFKLELNPDCQEYWVNNILRSPTGPQGPTIASHQRLRGAKDHFNKYVTDKMSAQGSGALLWLMNLYEKATRQLKVGQYIVGDSSEVGVIFEVMNDRGKPLSELEKVKNYLLYLSSKLQLENNSLSKTVNQTWADIFQRLMAAGLNSVDDEDRLLRSHWLMAYNSDAAFWEGSKSIKQRFTIKAFEGRHAQLLNELLDYIKTLRDSLVAFCDVANPAHTDSFGIFPGAIRPALQQSGEKLRRIRVIAPFLPLLMACRLRSPKDGEKYLALVKLCEIFAFRVYRIAMRRSNKGQAKLFRMAFRLFNGEVSFEDAMLELRAMAVKYCPGGELRSFADLNETEKNWYGWSGLKYFLYEYEQHLAGNKVVKLPWNVLEKADPQKSIEHILPQDPDSKYWKERFDRVARKKFTHDIGNLCLTEDNSSYGRKPFPDKKGQAGKGRCYANSNLFMERELAKFDDWTEKEIKERRKKIVAWYLDRWHLEETDLPQAPEEIEEEQEEIV